MAGPLQHQTTALPMPPFQPSDLRKDPDDRYAARSRLTTNPVSTTRGQGPPNSQGGPCIVDLLGDRTFPQVGRELKGGIP